MEYMRHTLFLKFSEAFWGLYPAISQSEGPGLGPGLRANAPFCLHAASAFSERYLGLHGLDNRAYEVCLGAAVTWDCSLFSRPAPS